MLTELKCLDKGFVRLVDKMGDDSSVVQAARCSYGHGTKTTSEDAGLINYLMRMWHSSPIEMVEFKFHIKCPIFVMRQLIRHRTASVNEVSARYSVVKDEFYQPEASRIQGQSKTNKQGSDGQLSEEVVSDFLICTDITSKSNYNQYERHIEQGVSRELARINLPLTAYTEFYWKIDLLNLLKFIRLRSDSHAQYEIRVFSDALADFVKENNPLVFAAFEKYWQNSMTLSDLEQKALAVILISDKVHFRDTFNIVTAKFSKGEAKEFETKLIKIGVINL